MSDSLFKHSHSPITPEEEENITLSLSSAYRAQEESGKDMQLQRIAKLVQKKLELQSSNAPNPDASLPAE